MSINSKQKGNRGEREWASVCKEQGYDSHRGQQFCGINGNADVIGLPHIYNEVKRVERLNIEDAMLQARYDSRNTNEIPIVAHRRNHEKWKVTMDADDWFKLYRVWESGKSLNDTGGLNNA